MAMELKHLNPQHVMDVTGKAIDEISRLRAENAELKQKLESVQASMYADVVDAGMENSRLKRALWLIFADLHFAKANEIYGRECMLGMWNDSKWEGRFKRKLHCERRCRAMAERYK